VVVRGATKPQEALIATEGEVDGRSTTTPSFPAPRFSQLVVVAACAVLIALTWLGTVSAMRARRAEALTRVEADVGNEALVFAEQLRRQLLAADQSLHILELEWQRDPAHFDLEAWHDRVVLLTEVSLQIFVSDATGIVRASTRPEIIGNNISGRDYFRHEAELPADDGHMFIGELTQGLTTKIWQLNLARRLDLPNGTFAGVIAASYDVGALNSFYGRARVGTGDIIAVVGVPDGVVRASAGAAAPPPNTSIAGSAMFAAMLTSPDQPWTGPSPLDGVQRVHAFGIVPDRNLRVVVGFDRDRAMRASADWETGAVTFATGITTLVLMMTALLLRADWQVRQREQMLAGDRAVLAAKNAELAVAERRAQAKTAQLEATLTGMTDGIMMMDADWNLLEWNENFPAFAGVPPGVLRPGLPMREIVRVQAELGEFGSVDIEAEVSRRMRLLQTGASMGTMVRTRPNGRILEVRRNPLADGGFVTLYSDITGRRQAEDRLRQAQTMAAIGRLTSGVAHDFNNLLASILGNAELLDNELHGDAKAARWVSVILQSATRGATLVRQLLAFSRKQALTPAPLDLNAVLTGLTELLRTTMGATVTLEWNLIPGLWPALVDAVQIEHVILNLAINARDAMPGGGRLVVATANLSLHAPDLPEDLAPGDYVAVSVTDTGTGMSDEVVRNAFEPFYTTKEPGKGSGLGLSQVYGVARQSGGSVQISSRLGEGTTVRVLLPRATSAAAAAAEGDAADRLPDRGGDDRGAPVGAGHTVLVVDDDANVRGTIAAVLSVGDFVVVEADGGSQALHLVDRGLDPDLMVLDFSMPGMDGVEVAAAMRRRLPDLPIVFVTGYGDGDALNGERRVLIKPFRATTLMKLLHEALEQARRAPRESRPPTQVY
jgi:signal transduction histidine kinase/ActR/RegA family two-component response regulator